MNNINICVNNLFNNEDYKSKITKKDINLHNNDESPWIILNDIVYSLKNNDKELLNLFKNYYGKDVKIFLLNNFNNKQRILLLKKLYKRKIGIIK
jgi:cytochrome b involved in lipid metabolism